jgi:hypothetical protein
MRLDLHIGPSLQHRSVVGAAASHGDFARAFELVEKAAGVAALRDAAG